MTNTESAAEQPIGFLERHSGAIQKLHEILFILNFINSLLYGLLLYIMRDWVDDWRPRSDLGYYFRCISLRFNDFLHLTTTNSVSTSALARQLTNRSDSFGAEILIALTLLTVTLSLYSVLQMLAGTPFQKVIVNYFAGVTTLFSLPVTFILVLRLTWHSGPLGISQVDLSPILVVSAVIISATVGVFILKIFRSSLSLRISGSILLVYALIWLRISWPEIVVFPIESVFILKVSIFVFPLSAIVWVVHQRTCNSVPCGAIIQKNIRLWGLTACLSAGLTLFMWRPPLSHPIDISGNLDSFSIELSRGACYGSCPQYKMKIRGDGNVEFVGHGYIHHEYRHQSTLTSQQVSSVLRALNRANFSALEDRAFQWCFDTSSVAVSVTIDGKSKTVTSDSSCTGLKSGVQDSFVRAASEIDDIVGTAKWIER
jgi:hypothetical protein